MQGHLRADGEDPLAEISARADERTTMIIYMGLATLPALVAKLCEQNPSGPSLPASLPAVAVMRGTTPEERCVFAPLGKLPAAVLEAGLKSPTLVIIGHVVSLSHLYPGHDQVRTVVHKVLQ